LTATFSLDPGAPAGARITPSGLFSWLPLEGQGPGEYAFTIRATDNGTPPMTDTETFLVTVREVNAPPAFVDTLEKHMQAGGTLSFPTAADRDWPAQTLTFLLDPTAPANATVNPLTGQFTWAVPSDQPTGTYFATVTAVDNGVPPLSASYTYTLRVHPADVPLVVVRVQFLDDNILLSWTATPGKTYRIETTETLNPETWVPRGLVQAQQPDMTMLLPRPTQGMITLRVGQVD
jgi:hypothetical protein